MKIEVLESASIKPGTVLEINVRGLIGSKRNAKDGITYFGTTNEEGVNDFIAPQTDKGFGKKHFYIKYDSDSKSYILKSLGGGSGTFINIKQKQMLKNNNIISFGDIHLATILPAATSDSKEEEKK